MAGSEGLKCCVALVVVHEDEVITNAATDKGAASRGPQGLKPISGGP